MSVHFLARQTLAMSLVAMLPAWSAEPDPDGLFTAAGPESTLVRSDTTLIRIPEFERPIARRDDPLGESRIELPSRLVHVDTALLASAREQVGLDGQARLNLNLFADLAFEAVIEAANETRGGYTLAGHLDGIPGSVVALAVRGDVVAGMIHAVDRIWMLENRGSGSHAIRPASGSFRCDTRLASTGTAPATARERGTAGGETAADRSEDDGSEIDVLVLFTTAVRKRLGFERVLTDVDLAVAATNEIFRVGEAVPRLNLVAAVETSYSSQGLEAGYDIGYSDGIDMSRLTFGDDGYLDEAHLLRDQYAADIVYLLYLGPSGRAWLLNPVSEEDQAWKGFAMVGIQTDGGGGTVTAAESFLQTFAHELGHVMGLRHDRFQGTGSDVHPYAYGYVNQLGLGDGEPDSRRWKTIMAYPFHCRGLDLYCPTLMRFSNPDQLYPETGGDMMGVPGDESTDAIDGPANAIRNLNETRNIVSNFRASEDRCEIDLDRANLTVSEDRTEVSLDVTTAEGCGWDVRVLDDFLSSNIDTGDTGSNSGQVVVTVEENAGGARVGYLAVGGETLTVRQGTARPHESVCDRSRHVRDTIMSALDAESCVSIDEFDLLAVKELDLSGKELSEDGGFKEGDLRGLVQLSVMKAIGSGIEELPSGLFEELENLEELNLFDNGITELPADGFRGLANLRRLNLDFNRINHLDEHSLEGLSSLSVLILSRNSGLVLSSGAFKTTTNLLALGLSGTALTEVPGADVFSGLSNLSELDLSDNAISSIPAAAFSTIPGLRRLFLRDNAIRVLEDRSFEGLDELFYLVLSGNPLDSLPEGVFADKGLLNWLLLDGLELTELPPRVFDGLDSLFWLDLSQNKIADLRGVEWPGRQIGQFAFANNRLMSIPVGMFEGWISDNCFQGQLLLDLRGNPGAPFSLRPNLLRIDGGLAAAGPATVILDLPEGAPTPMTLEVEMLGTDGAWRRFVGASIQNGAVKGETFEVNEDGPTALRLAEPAGSGLPSTLRALRVEVGDPVRLFGLDDQELRLGSGPFALDLDDALGKEGMSFEYAAQSRDGAVATVRLEDGSLFVDPHAEGTTTITVTATAEDGSQTVRSFRFQVSAAFQPADVPYVPSGSDGLRQGFVRVINHSGTAGEVRIDAVGDDGSRFGPLTLTVGANGTHHFNSDDLESGNTEKGLSGGVGQGLGGLRLELESDLDIEALSYIRTTDGFLTSMHDLAPQDDGVHRVAIFNPGSNIDQASVLRLINPGMENAVVTIRGIDDDGASPGSDIEVTVPAGATGRLSSTDLESGSGVTGALGDGTGKWELRISADNPIRVMSLLESPAGHLTNLSTTPIPERNTHAVPLFPAGSDELGRQGFVRVINRGGEVAEVDIAAFDDTDRDYGQLTLTVGAKEAVHFNSDDLELGNEDKGLSGSTGAGQGDWRLELTSDADIEVLSYIRTTDGFLTSMHDVVPAVEGRHRVGIFNPGSNTNQVSRLRMINAGDETAQVTITGIDDQGNSPGDEVRTSISAETVRSYTAAELESGTTDLEGSLGTGIGKWQLTVESNRPITVMSLMESPMGHLTNLSTAPGRDAGAGTAEDLVGGLSDPKK